MGADTVTVLGELAELASRVASTFLNKRQADKAARRVVLGWANWYRNRWTVFERAEKERDARWIGFRKNLQWMGDHMTQQLGMIKGSLDDKLWTKANDFATEAWILGSKIYSPATVIFEDWDLTINDGKKDEFLARCKKLQQEAEKLIELSL